MCKTLIMSRIFFYLFTLLTATFLSAQTIPQTENICFFQDAKTGKPITIVNDSLVYKGELKNPTILKHTDFPDVLKNYTYHFNIKQHTYLVHVGCGPVLEYRNDSIVRIDNSFIQKNQYGASPFIYKNQICLFGGYGLFTSKNIITSFDIKTKEWFRLYYNEEEKPIERSGTLTYYNEKGVFIFGGWETGLTTSFEKDHNIWHLNYSNLEWQNLGVYNNKIADFITKSKDNFFTFQSNKKLYLVNGENIVTLDFNNNTASYFDNKNIFSEPEGLYFDSISNSLIYLQYLSGINKVELETLPLTQLLKNRIKIEKLYYYPWQDYAIPILLLVLTLLLVFGIHKWINNKKGKCFIFNQTQNKLYYKTKIINNLNPLEEKIVVFLFQNNTTFIQLNQLNSFFEKESPDNVTNVIKKRDLVFSSLLVKLNAIVTQNESPLILIQKNDVDKRIKEIKLNPLYFTLK